MKVIVHSKPVLEHQLVRLFDYSTKKKNSMWWIYYDCEYYPDRKRFHEKKTYLLDRVIEQLYEATHDVPNCDDCELVNVDDCYCETRAIMLEDRD